MTLPYSPGDRVRTTSNQPPSIGVAGVVGKVIAINFSFPDLPLIVLFDGHKEEIAMRLDEVEGIPR